MEMRTLKKMLFVMNPCAGQKRAGRHLTDAIAVFNRAGYEVATYMTAGPGDAAEVVRERAGDLDLIVCCGGDGTFNEVVTGVMHSGVRVPLGYLPAGTTNDFASGLKLPTDLQAGARAIVEGKPVLYDVGQFGDRYFTYVASFGAFTRASYATPQTVKNALGHTAYVLEGIQELSQIRKEHLRLELEDGSVIEDDFVFGAISNSTCVGGVLTLDPSRVDLRDGKFEVLLIRAPRDLVELSECIHALRTQKYNCKAITFCSASEIRITAGEHMDWSLDGERATGRSQVTVKNIHNAIELIQKEE